MELKELKVTFEELFELLNIDKTMYNESQYVNDDVFVNTPSGFKKINGCIIKNKCKMYKFTFNNIYCRVADTHIFSVNNKEVYAKNLNIGDVIDSEFGYKTITNKKFIGEFDGYDINIDYPHWYYNPDGIIYHNTLFKTDLISGMIKKGKKILLISMEMSDKEIMKRVHTNAFDLPINSLTDLGKTENELLKLKEENPGRIQVSKDDIISKYKDLKMSGQLGKLYIKDYPSGYFSANMLDSLLESYKNELDLDFDIVFLDYLGIMKSDLLHPSAGLYSYVKSIVEEVRAIAKKRQLPIISSSQLNRSAVNSTDASNDSVSDSLGTVQTADFMLFLLQTEEMKAQKKILCKVTKNRFNGRTDSWEMDVDYQYMRFQDSNKLTVNPNDGNILDLVNDDLKANINIIKASNSKNNVLNDDFGLMMNDINAQDVKEIQESRETKILSADDELNKLLGL